jgi:HPt (histidine-containing phosphotransfer) domain-containing protein
MESNPAPSSGLPSEPASGVLDLNVMEQLLNLDDGELGLLKEMMGLFVDDTPGRIQAIEAALASGDLSDLADVAHAVKGAAGTMGVPKVRVVAAELEHGGRKGAFSTDPHLLLEHLKEAYADGLAALQAYVAGREKG